MGENSHKIITFEKDFIDKEHKKQQIKQFSYEIKGNHRHILKNKLHGSLWDTSISICNIE